MILTLSGSSGCGSGGRHSDLRSFSSCSVCNVKREQEQWACTGLRLQHCHSTLEAVQVPSPRQDKQLQSDRKTLLQALLLHTASIQESTAASPALSLLSPAAVSPLLAFAAVLPPPSSSSSPVPPSSCAPFPGLHVRMPDTPRPAAASGLGFGFSLPYKCEQGVVRAGRPLSESRAG